MKHTKGPWKYDDTWGLIMAGNEEIAAVHSCIKANAQLLTAAPEMLAALELAHEKLKAMPELPEGWTALAMMVASSLHKAKGRE